MPYVPTVWVDDAAPGVSASNLNKMEVAIEDATDLIENFESGATVATTVAGLGTPNDGKLGHLKLGTTPFDFIALTYDATYGKWVSAAEKMIAVSGSRYLGDADRFIAMGDAAGSSDATGNASYFAGTPYLPWRPLDTAGLKPQFRFAGRLYDENSNAGKTTKGYFSADNNSVNTRTQVTNADWIAPGSFPTTVTFKDTGWYDPFNGGAYTVKDFIKPEMRFTGSASGAFIYVEFLTLLVRWVS
jgi:hypothetical protein